MTEYLRLKNFHCSRQRIEQVAVELGLKHSPQDRAPEWEFMRKARKLGNLDFANREWLAERLSKAISIASLAAELGVDEENLYFFIRGFKLTHPLIRKYGTMTVDLVCAQCGGGFKRLKRWVDQAHKRATGKVPEFFCSTSCVGKRNWRKEPERYKLFIRENWQDMSDAQMAEELGLAQKTVAQKRQAIGLKRVNNAA